MMEPCPITKQVCLLRPGGYRLEDCKYCPEITKFLELTDLKEVFGSSAGHFITWLEAETLRNAPKGSFLERCYRVVTENLEEVL